MQDSSRSKVRVDNVMDLATGKPYNLIHGRHRFRIAGYNMDLNDEGATVFLTDRHGVTYEVTVDEVVSKQLIIAHSTDLLEAGETMTVMVTDTYDEYPIEDWEVNDDGTEITFERDMGNDVVGSNAKFIANIGATLEKEGIVIAAHE